MAYPIVQATSTYTQVNTVSSNNVSLPSGIQSGELLLLFVQVASGSTITTPSGWNLEQTQGSGIHELALYSRVADGTEGATVNVLLSTARRNLAFVFRVSGHDGLSSTSNIASSSSQADPASLNPGWGSEEILWIVGEGRGLPSTFSSYSSGYTGLFQNNTGNTAGNSSHAAMSVAVLEKTDSSEDPGVVSYSVNNSTWRTITVGIRPGSAPTPSRLMMMGVGS